jgi:hypothetical protein
MEYDREQNLDPNRDPYRDPTLDPMSDPNFDPNADPTFGRNRDVEQDDSYDQGIRQGQPPSGMDTLRGTLPDNDDMEAEDSVWQMGGDIDQSYRPGARQGDTDLDQ